MVLSEIQYYSNSNAIIKPNTFDDSIGARERKSDHGTRHFSERINVACCAVCSNGKIMVALERAITEHLYSG